MADFHDGMLDVHVPKALEASRPQTTKVAIGVSVLLLALRMSLAETLGFGDSEALYSTYALFKQATFLEHPGLIGSVDDRYETTDEDDVWPDNAEAIDYDENFGKDIWDNVLGTFSLN